MNKSLIIVLCFVALGTSIVMFPDGPTAVMIGGVLAAAAIVILGKQSQDREFLLKVFLIGLILRAVSAVLINSFKLQEFFGPDSLYYDFLGDVLSGNWLGNIPDNYPDLAKIRDTSQSGWGMNYIIAGVYFFTGRNPLAAQFFCSVLGAATAPVVYICSREIFANKRVARLASIIVAVCPSLILWSSQALKDGIIVFFLVLSTAMVLQLQKKLNYLSLIVLLISLFGILSLRFYIFYMMIVAIVGCFAVGQPLNPMSILRRASMFLIIGLTMNLLGAGGERDLSKFNLDKIQTTRQDLARGNAGFAKEADVSTTEGALSTLPLGFTYLMLAPFPWQVENLRQALTLPEMLLWWASIPLLISGLWYSIKYRLRPAFAVLLFTTMLTVSYSLYQGNVGTAYRQRAQIQIFHFMFIAVGWTLWKEKKENERALRIAKRNSTLKSFQER